MCIILATNVHNWQSKMIIIIVIITKNNWNYHKNDASDYNLIVIFWNNHELY